MGNGFVMDLELQLDVDKSKIAQQISKILSDAQKFADSNKINLGADFKKDTLREIGKQFASFTKNLKVEPAKLDQLFNDEKIKNEVLDILDSIEKLEDKIKELSNAGSFDVSKLKRFNETDIRKRIQDQFDLVEALYNDDYELDFQFKTDLDAQKAKKEAQGLFDEINSILREYEGTDKIKNILKGDLTWWTDLKQIGDHFNLKLNFEPFKQDNSKLEELSKERDELFEKLAGKYMNWTNVNFESIMSKMTSEVELVPKISDSFKSDAEKLIQGLNLEAEVNLIGKIGEDGFIDAEQLEQVLGGISRAFSNMQKDGKFSLDLINKDDIQDIKDDLKSLNEFTDLLKLKGKSKSKISNGSLLKAFNDVNNNTNVFDRFNDMAEVNKINGYKAYDESSYAHFDIINPNTGEVFESYNGIIELLEMLAKEYEIAGEEAKEFNSLMGNAKKGLEYYNDLENAWFALGDHIQNVTGKVAQNSPPYIKEVETTSTIFHKIYKDMNTATSAISDTLEEVVKKLESINNKTFDVTINSMNDLNSAAKKTVDNIGQLGTVLKLIAEADKINRELMISQRFDSKGNDRVLRERGLLYNSKTGKISNPFTWDRQGSVSWDTYKKLGYNRYSDKQHNKWDTMIHSHSGDDVLVPSMSTGDMSVAIGSYIETGMKNHIIVATDEIMHLNMEAAKEALIKSGKLEKNASDARFRNVWDQFVDKMESETNHFGKGRFDLDELEYYIKNGNLNIYKEKYDSSNSEELYKSLLDTLRNYDYDDKSDEAFKILESSLKERNGQKIDDSFKKSLKKDLLLKFAKKFGDIGADIVDDFLGNYLDFYLEDFRSARIGLDVPSNAKGIGTKESMALRNYWLGSIRPGLDDAIKEFGLQSAFNFYTPEEFEKEYNISSRSGILNGDTKEASEYAETLQKILDILDEINKNKIDIDVVLSDDFEQFKQSLNDINEYLFKFQTLIDKINFNDGLIDTGKTSINPIFDYLEKAYNEEIKVDWNFVELDNRMAFHEPFKNAIGLNKEQLNNSLKSYFNDINITYESIVSLFEKIGELNNFSGTDAFELPLKWLKEESDLIKKNKFSDMDLSALENINNLLGDHNLLNFWNLESSAGYDKSTKVYEFGKNGTIFDLMLESLNELKSKSASINISEIFDAKQLDDGIKKIRELANDIERIGKEFSNVFDNLDLSSVSEKFRNLISEISTNDNKLRIDFEISDFDEEKIEKLRKIIEKIQKYIEEINRNSSRVTLFSDIFNGFNFEEIDEERINKLFTAISNFADSINGLNLNNNSFIAQLKELLQYSDELKNLAEILSKSKEEITGAGSVIGAGKSIDSNAEELYSKIKNLQDTYFGLSEEKLNRDLDILEEDSRINAYKEMIELEKELSSLILQEGADQKLLIDLVDRRVELESQLNVKKKESSIEKEYSKLFDFLDEYKKASAELGKEGGIDNASSDTIARFDNANKLVSEQIELIKKLGIVQNDYEKIVSKKNKEAEKSLSSNLAKYYKNITSKDDSSLSENGKKLKELQISTSSYYKTLEKMMGGTATKKDYKTNASSYQNMIRLQNELANATDKTNKEQEKYSELVKMSESLMSNLNDNAQNLGKTFISNLSLDQNSSAFQKIGQEYQQWVKRLSQVDSKDSLMSWIGEYKEIEKMYNSFQKLYSKSSDVRIFGNYFDALTDLKSQAMDFGHIVKQVGDLHPDGNGMAKYTVIVKQATGETRQFSAVWDEAVHSMAFSVKELGNTGRMGFLGFFDNIKKKIYDVSSYMLGVYFSPMDWIRYIREGINYVKEMDTALTEMRKVSDESLESLKRYQVTTFDTAQAIGTTATELQRSTADWMRLGESLQQASKSAEVSTILSNVSEFENIDDATKALVAVSQAYTDLDKMTIVDKLNEVGNNYSISTDELASGLQRSASTLSLMGNTIDEAAALITAGNATIQNAESVATGMKVISLRLVGTKEAQEELKVDGEDIEDAFIQMTQSKKQQIIKDYTAVASNNYQGFDILDQNGNYKNTYDILLGISKIYKEIQAEDKKFGTNRANALIEELAGKVRSNIVAATLQNGSMLEDVRASSEGAEGSALRENEKYLDSVEGKIKQLTTGIEEFWNRAIHADDLKVVISLLTEALNIVNEIVGAIGSLPTMLSVITPFLLNKNGMGILSYGALKDENGNFIEVDGKKQYQYQGLLAELFNKKEKESSDNSISDTLADSINGVADSEENLVDASNNAANSTGKLSGMFTTLTGVAKTVAASLISIGVSMAISFAITQIIKGIDILINGNKRLIESGKNAADSISEEFESYNKNVSTLKTVSETLADETTSINSTSDAISNLGDKYVELSNGVNSFDNSNISLTNEEYQMFLDTSNKIAEVLPSLVNKYDANGNAMLNLGNDAEEASKKIDEALRSQQLLSHYNISGETVTQMKGISEQSRLYNRDKATSNETIREIEETIRSFEQGRIAITITEEERLERLNELYKELAEEKENNSAVDKLLAQNYKSFIPTLESLLKTDSEFTDLNETIQEKLINSIGDLSSEGIKEIIENSDGDSIKLMTYLEKVFVDPFEKLEEEGLTERLLALFDFDSSDLKFNDYLLYIDDELSKIFPDDKSQVARWRSILGVDDLVKQNKKIDKILSDTTDELKVTKNQFDTLTMEDRNIAYSLIVNDKFTGTFDELQKKIDETKKKLNEEDLFATPLLNAYNKAVEEAGENGNPGKNYDSYGAALKSLKEQYDKELIGTDTFKKGAKMFSIGGASDANNFIENYNRFIKYFNEEEPVKGLKNFVNDMTKLNLMEKTDDGGFKTKFEDIREAAARAKMPVELFISMFDKLEEFGGYNDFFATAEDGFSTVGELTGELAVAKAELQDLMDTQPKNKSAIKAKEEEIKSLESRLSDAQDQLMKFLSEDGIDEYTKNYSAQTSAAQKALTRLNGSENYRNADENQRQIMLEAIRSGFESSGLDSSIYKNLGINKNGKIVLDVTASNERIDQVLEAYDAKSDKKFEQYGNKTAQQIVEQWSKEAGFSNITEYLDSIRGENGVTPEDKTENTVVNPIVTAANMLVDAINNNTAALNGDTTPKREVNDKFNAVDRPIVSSEFVSEAGWGDNDGKRSTVLTARRSDENGKQFVFTPILPNGEVYEKDEFDKYMDSVLDGGEDEYNLFIASFEGEDAEKAASDYEDALHKVHDAYFLGDEAAKESLHVLDNYTAKELRAIDLTDDSTSKMEDSFVSLMNSLGITEDEVEQFINVLEDMNLLKITPKFSMSGMESVEQLEEKISDQLNEGQTMTYTAKVEGVKGTTEINATEVEGEIVYTANVDGVEKEVKPVTQKDGTITYETVVKDDKGKTDKKNKDGGTATVKTEMDTTGFDKGKKEVSQGVQTLTSKEAKPKVDLQGATDASNELSRFRSNLNSLPSEKKITLTTVKRTIIDKKYNNTNSEGNVSKGSSFNGTFHLSHAYARGTTATSNVSIRKDETALINELGKEIVVRDGKALTFNNGYPVYANLKKNDIVFNHKQTEELERKGYVTGSHAKIYGGGSAFVNGTVDDEEELMNAFRDGTGAGIDFKTSSKSSTTKKQSSKKSTASKKKKSTTTKKKKNKNSKNAWEKFEEWLSNLFDWVEIRLDNLSKKTEAWTNLFEKFLNAASDNAQAAYNAAISAARNEQTYAYKASDRYLEEAIDVGLEGAKAAGTTGKGKKKKRKISDDWVMNTYERLLNDDLSETEIGKLDDKKKSIVDAMKDYIDKARDAADSTVELTESINDLIVKQRDAKVEFRKSAFSSAVEGNKGYTAATKNSVLTQSTAVAEYSNNQYASTLASQESQFNTLSSNALSVSSANASSNKKVLSKLKGAKKNTYISNLNSASSAIKAKKAVSESVINYFRKMNPSVAAKYLAYNTQIALLENSRAELADNFAENMSTIIDNVAESYANLDEEAQQAIDLAQSRAENATSYTEANNILNEVYKLQDKILDNDRAEINKYASMMSGYKNKIVGANFRGTMFSAASGAVQKDVQKICGDASSAVSNGKMIPDSLMIKMYDYMSKGYISVGFYQSCRSWNMLFAQGEQAQAQLKIDQETAKKEKLNTFRTQIGNIESNYNDRVSEAEAIKESIVGNYEDSITQGNIIKLRIQEANELQIALQNALDTGVIKKGDSAWYEYSIKIQEARNEVEKLKQTQFETELAEQFDRAIEKAQQFIDKLETINDLIADEMLFDTKSGKMTDMGWMSLGLNSQAMAKEQEVLEKYLKERDVILKAYQEGNKSFFGDQSFDEMIEENAKNILSSISSINSFKESILDLIEGLAEAELKALQKVVDKRKEALQKKKDYYDYDKTIKGKTKDLQSLEQQIRALEGVAGQEAAAKRASLMAQRKESQEDLDETVKEHIYNMQVQGLDEMMDGLQEDLEKWKEDLHSDLDLQKQAIDNIISRMSSDSISYSNMSTLLSDISGKTITVEQMRSIMAAASNTMSNTGTTASGASGNVDTSKGSSVTGSSSVQNMTAKVTTTAKPATVTTTAKPVTTTKKVVAVTTTKKVTTTTTTKKLTVTKANAEKALKTMMDNLVYHDTEGKEWGALNKALWRKKDFTRKVYVKHENLVKAWKQMGFAEKNYSGTNLMNALKNTGAWAILEAVRTDGKTIKKPKLDYSKIHGYAKGGTVHKRGQYLTDEKGEEIIITKQGILRPLSAGTSVIPADITERLYAIASDYDMKSRVQSPNLQNIQRLGGEVIAPVINCPITIEGNAKEQDVINAINKTLPHISKHIQNDIRKDLRKSGR